MKEGEETEKGGEDMENKQQTDLTAQITSQMQELVELKNSFKAEQIQFIKGLINPNLTDNELYMFLVYANKSGLNPFNKEIIAVAYNGQAGRTVNTIITRDGKRAVAYRKGGIESINTTPIYIKENVQSKKIERCEAWEGGKLWGASCIVVRNGKQYTATVPLNEYNTGKSIWAGKPETMIKKVAESQALSMAVPELLGIYDEAEMPSADALPTQAPVSADDDKPATDAQKKTIQALANRNGLKVNVEEMTQKTAKAWIAGVNQK